MYYWISICKKVNLVDYPIVVIETLKALFNIILCYPELNERLDNRELWENTLKVLEQQMDCSVKNILNEKTPNHVKFYTSILFFV